MKSGQMSPGFTIIETLIFLAVSSTLITSAFLLVGGAQNKTEFTQAVNEIRGEIEQVANTVATGYYAGSDTTRCQVTSSDPAAALSISNAGGDRGTSTGCVYLGRVIYFSNGSDYALWNVAGRREMPGSGSPTARRTVTDISLAQTTAFGKTDARLKNGLEVKRMAFRKGGSVSNTAAVGFFSTLGSTNAANPDLLRSQSQQYDITGLPGLSLGALSDANLSASVASLRGSTRYTDARNPDGGIKICFDSGGTNQRAIITVGGGGRGSTTTLKIESGKCAAATLF